MHNLGRSRVDAFDRRRAQRGFTLVELLVVVAIIALLLAILLPALGKARVVAKRVVCGSNQRQVGIAAATHASERKDRFPLAGLQWGVPSYTPEGLYDKGEEIWTYYTDSGVRRVQPMVAQLGQFMDLKFRDDSRAHMEEDINGRAVEKYFHDPAEQEIQGGNIRLGRYDGWRDTIRPEPSSYAFSEGILGYRGATSHAVVTPDPAALRANIKKHSDTLFAIDAKASTSSDSLVFFDVDNDGDDHGTFHEYYVVNEEQGNLWGSMVDFMRHDGFMNAVFVDGHVETIPTGGDPDEVPVDRWERFYVRY
jgi:prepilin-type N-terminal cleavage/methylation domain-containing protein/prepilin-type processing-associated H-X9-DG protein